MGWNERPCADISMSLGAVSRKKKVPNKIQSPPPPLGVYKKSFLRAASLPVKIRAAHGILGIDVWLLKCVDIWRRRGACGTFCSLPERWILWTKRSRVTCRTQSWCACALWKTRVGKRGRKRGCRVTGTGKKFKWTWVLFDKHSTVTDTLTQ